MDTQDRKTKDEAFTVIELLVVIAIIGILAGMLMPALSGIRKNARIGTTRATIKEVQAALTQFLTDKGSYPLDDIDLQIGNTEVKIPLTVVPKPEFCLTRTLVEAFDGDGYKDGPNAPYLEFKSENTDNFTTLMTGTTTPYDTNLIDIWNKPFHYRQNYKIRYKYQQPPIHNLLGDSNLPDPFYPKDCIYNPDTFDFWSDGPDGEPDTGDELGNWD